MYCCGSHHKALIGTNIRGCFRPANMLLASLQRKCVACFTVEINRAPNDASGHLAHQGLLAAQEAEIGPATGQGDTQRLSFTYRNVRSFGSPVSGGG